MRKISILLPAILLVAITSFAQTAVEIIPFGGYTFASRNDFYDYNTFGRIDGGFNVGASMRFNINRNVGIEVLYNHMNTFSNLYDYRYGDKIAGGNLGFDYIMIGPVQSFNIPGSTVRPFIGAMLGAAVLTPEEGAGYSSETKFAAGFQLGTNIYVSPRVGLQLKAQLLSPVDAAGGGFYFSNYGGGGGIDTYSSIYQFSLNAGLIIGLGQVLPEQVYHRPARRPGPRYHRFYY